MVEQHRVRNIILAGLALVAGFYFLAPMTLGGRTEYLATQGTSMLPAIHTGDLAVIRAKSAYHVGEVVAYQNTDLQETVLHRIIAIDGSHYILQGDHNPAPDIDHPTKSAIEGQMVMLLPHVGAMHAWLIGTPLGLLGLGTVAAVIMTSSHEPRRRRRGRYPRRFF